MITQDLPKELFIYREDGNLIWSKSSSKRVKKGLLPIKKVYKRRICDLAK